MTQQEQQKAAAIFAEKWAGRGDEKSETHNYWIELLRSILGVENPESFIEFEKRVQLDHTSFIDGYIPTTKVLIEQKSIDIDLRKAAKQSDGTELTPYQQAHRYAANMKLSEMPRWIVVCNFRQILIYDMEKPKEEPEEIMLENLGKEYYRLTFLSDNMNVHIQREMELSIKAGEIVGLIYDKLLKQYKNPDSEKTLKSLNMLCVRLVFCLYAEDAGLFRTKSQFHDYIETFATDNIRQAMLALFRVLDTPNEDRDPELEDKLAAFPYVNGGLFTEEDLSIPQFSEELRELLLTKASADFDWSEISPTIFGAVFESTLNPDTRRKGGMHYTSIENIHKVIDPLFMNDLRAELNEIKKIDILGKRQSELEKFQNKISSLKFLDPACGSGNFLTESYLSLARLEIEALNASKDRDDLFVKGQNKVSIHQFYGIEINDFAAVVAKTALWIAESQVSKEVNEILITKNDFLPLRNYSNIVEGNALRIDWATLKPENPDIYTMPNTLFWQQPEAETELKYDYIMGNPPFVGARLMNDAQKDDVANVWQNAKNIGNLDYVSCWYKKTAEL
ncbi:MAG: SAM-dependent DNA methyltransferase, partial [Spirochaetales bacterium]|nr:SAM-dependent DNA methyltransferase [Spirochaetales bacterium]